MLPEAAGQGLRGGASLDISHVDEVIGETWDLSTEQNQRRVWKLLGRDEPLVLRLSPECTLFRQLQKFRETEIDKELIAKATECVKSCVNVK